MLWRRSTLDCLLKEAKASLFFSYSHHHHPLFLLPVKTPPLSPTVRNMSSCDSVGVHQLGLAAPYGRYWCQLFALLFSPNMTCSFVWLLISYSIYSCLISLLTLIYSKQLLRSPSSLYFFGPFTPCSVFLAIWFFFRRLFLAEAAFFRLALGICHDTMSFLRTWPFPW